jgi:hypothetical protein
LLFEGPRVFYVDSWKPIVALCAEPVAGERAARLRWCRRYGCRREPMERGGGGSVPEHVVRCRRNRALDPCSSGGASPRTICARPGVATPSAAVSRSRSRNFQVQRERAVSMPWSRAGSGGAKLLARPFRGPRVFHVEPGTGSSQRLCAEPVARERAARLRWFRRYGCRREPMERGGGGSVPEHVMRCRRNRALDSRSSGSASPPHDLYAPGSRHAVRRRVSEQKS